MGYCSRRKADEYIGSGKVRVNKQTVTEMGHKVDPTKDEVEVMGLEAKKSNVDNYVYFKMNKPFGYECTVKAEEGSKTVYDLIKVRERVFTVGRLDKESEGLLLFTNDGRLVYQLTHPKFEKEKEYEVTVDRNITDGHLKIMANGVDILGKTTAPAKVVRVSQRKFNIVLKEGMNRQIRRMCRKVGYRVHRLRRLRIGEIKLGNLEQGVLYPLNKKEMAFISRVLTTKVD